MRVHLKTKLVILPLLACSTWSFAAGPVELDAASMDRVTAGSQTALERIANLLAAVPAGPGNFLLHAFLPLPGAEQQALLTRLAAGELVAFHQLAGGELVVTPPLAAGEQLVLLKQLGAPDARAQNAGDGITTSPLNQGETLHLQQTSLGGVNYLYVHGTGSYSVTTFQKNGL